MTAPKSALEKEYKEAMATRDRAKKAGSKALLDRAERRMAEIQVQMFHETARAVGASNNPKDLDRALKKIAPRKAS